MRRRAIAAVVLSMGLLVLVPAVPATTTSARVTPDIARSAADEPIPPDPSVVQAGSDMGAWSARYAARPATYALTGGVLSAYLGAVAAAPPRCHLAVSLLAAIGQVESGNLAGRLDAGNRAVPAIIGPALDGHGTRVVADTDAGRWDGDRVWDRALGPLQFIPSAWRAFGVDLDGDGVRDPQDLDDAAGGAMAYLCADRDLATRAGVRAALLSYNHSRAYLRSVLAWKSAFDSMDPVLWGSTPLLDAWPVLGRTHATAAGATANPSAKPVRTKEHVAVAAAPVEPVTAAVPAPSPTSTPTSTPATTPASPPGSSPAPPGDDSEGLPAPVDSPSPGAPAGSTPTGRPDHPRPTDHPGLPGQPPAAPGCPTPLPQAAPTTDPSPVDPSPVDAGPIDPGSTTPGPSDGDEAVQCPPVPDPVPQPGAPGQ